MKYLTWVELNREAYNFNMQSFKGVLRCIAPKGPSLFPWQEKSIYQKLLFS